MCFSIGMLLALVISFLCKASFRTVAKVLINSFISVLMLLIFKMLGVIEPTALHYLICGLLGLMGVPVIFFIV